VGDTITGIIAGFVRDRHSSTPLSSDTYTHVDVTMLGIENRGSLIHTRGLLRSSDSRPGAEINFSLAGITNSGGISGTMPSCRTSFNGGFCISYEFEATRAVVDFEMNTRVRIRAFRETAAIALDEGVFFSSTRITSWRANGIRTLNIPAVMIPKPDNIEDMISSITGQSSVLEALSEGVETAITEGTVVDTISSYTDLMDTVINPNSRHIFISIVIIDL
jgi:hypothetical protein